MGILSIAVSHQLLLGPLQCCFFGGYCFQTYCKTPKYLDSGKSSNCSGPVHVHRCRCGGQFSSNARVLSCVADIGTAECIVAPFFGWLGRKFCVSWNGFGHLHVTVLARCCRWGCFCAHHMFVRGSGRDVCGRFRSTCICVGIFRVVGVVLAAAVGGVAVVVCSVCCLAPLNLTVFSDKLS